MRNAPDNACMGLIVTKSRIISDLRQLGVAAGQCIMLHVSVKAIGEIVGGPDVVLDALLEVLTPSGTLMMGVGWEDDPYTMADWPDEKRQAYLAECPPFDPLTSRANRQWSILCEYIRTRSGAHRSSHPGHSFVAIGAKAKWLVEPHPLLYGFGAGTPLARFVEAGGSVLMLGAPLCTATLLHHAECLANISNKRIVRYEAPVLNEGRRTWASVEEFDTNNGIVDWQGADYFELILASFIAAGKAKQGQAGGAGSYLLDAQLLIAWAVKWMERHLQR